jgi:anti-anti-sigma factor
MPATGRNDVLRVTAEPVDTHAAVLYLSGDVDQDSVTELARAVDKCLADGCTQLAIDCAGLRSCDSSGITALLRAHQSAAACGGALELTSINPVLRSRLQLTGLDQILTLVDGAPATSPPLLVMPETTDPSSVEAQTESLVRLTSQGTLPAAAADALNAAAQNAADTAAETMTGPVRSRDALAALEEMHADGREGRRRALDAARRGGSADEC